MTYKLSCLGFYMLIYPDGIQRRVEWVYESNNFEKYKF